MTVFIDYSEHATRAGENGPQRRDIAESGFLQTGSNSGECTVHATRAAVSWPRTQPEVQTKLESQIP